MGKENRAFLMFKLWLIFICCLGAAGVAAEIGQFTELSGEIVISRNREPRFQPVVASRVYTNDLVTLAEMSFAIIETPQNIWQIQGPARFTINSADNFAAEYGALDFQLKPPREKNVFLAVAESVIFPGLGHWYIEDYAKALPLLSISGLMLIGIYTANPELSSAPERTAELRQNYLQIYLAYMLVAALDAWSEAGALNRRLAENRALLEE
ncbi:hypothetical protein NO1_1182 [Candidatus Termititenax aidoneus]|uniref:Uncharacterized protein n=1 Tax=Termititenax aidoneus TaxID=2218524 RepID=A0A388TBU9_TERA1|nr:hypothetical protein NO1_1182 [Candidatus Termititenax aidoneus]